MYKVIRINVFQLTCDDQRTWTLYPFLHGSINKTGL